MHILGIDEVGRGPWAGPLVVGAVILPESTAPSDWQSELTDSKKLTPKKRQKLNQLIKTHALATALGWVSSSELDHIGLSASLTLATSRALRQIQAQSIPFNQIIIDGNFNFLHHTPFEPYVSTLKQADLLVKPVSAASIIAKVARDQYMTNLSAIYPEYHFDRHFGYGTKLHQSALRNFGPTPEHRRSFRPIASLISQNTSNLASKPSSGQIAEAKVAEYLSAQGHQIIATNYRTKLYEIDIISKYHRTLYFTEVKYRLNPDHGEPLDFITPAKHRQMTFAAENFLAFYQTNLEPKLAVASVSGRNYNIDQFFTLD